MADTPIRPPPPLDAVAIPVTIASPTPLPVTIADPLPRVTTKSGEHVQRQSSDPSLPAQTTFQQDLTFAGQRHINVMWEGTQRNIAMLVTGSALAVTAFLVMWPDTPNELRLVAYSTLSNVFFAVTSVYFTRTNHTKTGGVGHNEAGR